MASASSFDFTACYPPAAHAPYWITILGFITSTFITYITYSSGHGIFSLFKLFVCCKCCSNNKPNKNERNQWKHFPGIINISSANVIKLTPQAAGIYGDYILKYNDDAQDKEPLPHYESVAPTSFNQKKYIWEYLKQEEPYYNGWVLMVEDEKNYKYDMIQCDAVSFDTRLLLQPFTSYNYDDEKENSDRDALMMVNQAQYESIVVDDTQEPLQALDRLNQECIVYCTEENKLTMPQFWDNSVEYTQFFCKETNAQRNAHDIFSTIISKLIYEDIIAQEEFITNEHWIKFENFAVYKHNVWGHEVLDINGKYILQNVKDYSESDDPRHDGHEVEFHFQHEQIPELSCVFISIPTAFIDRSSRGKYIHKTHVYHEKLNKLVDIWDCEKRSYSECSCVQYVFGEGVDTVIKVEETTVFCYRFGQFVQIVFTLMGLYQFIYDVIYFVEYAKNENVSKWRKYECYSYIVTNSANMKQCIVFGVCCMINGYSFLYRKSTVIGRAFFVVVFSYIVAVVPVALTHIIPFFFAYLYFLIPIVCLFAKMEVDENWNFKGILLGGLLIYFIYALWPVACMSKLYNGERYAFSLYSVWNERHTVDYIDHYVDLYHSVTQFVLWIV